MLFDDAMRFVSPSLLAHHGILYDVYIVHYTNAMVMHPRSLPHCLFQCTPAVMLLYDVYVVD